ncbi:hypothetical protein LshimejAT787_2000130 [Lyophyllum shimeji]|uniref:Uncharacterized protein n=1 Tax=Lyophyllum shimeji TaxID=47721 RepID=A0A9P3Q0Y1_LYOSH|nr:hypothetical protein LshimejAT787_2000130 [Lyophyllum shimeji]
MGRSNGNDPSAAPFSSTPAAQSSYAAPAQGTCTWYVHGISVYRGEQLRGHRHGFEVSLHVVVESWPPEMIGDGGFECRNARDDQVRRAPPADAKPICLPGDELVPPPTLLSPQTTSTDEEPGRTF